MDMREYMKNRRLKRRKFFLDLLGGECAHCGEKDYKSLQFDRINPKTKKFDYNDARDGPLDILEKEMKKIQILCRKCHLKKTIKNKENLYKRKSKGH